MNPGKPPDIDALRARVRAEAVANGTWGKVPTSGDGLATHVSEKYDEHGRLNSDANVVLRWLLNDVPKQAAAVQRFVLDRTLGLSRDLVADYLDAVLALAQIQIDRKIWGAAVSTYRTHPKLSVADCYLTALATSTGETPLHTFDAKLARQLQGAELLR